MDDSRAHGFLSESVFRKIDRINEAGAFLGIVIPNSFEMSPLIQSPSFVPDPKLPYLDLFGKRFRFGRVEDKKVILVITGQSMISSTQLFLTLFKIKGVLHYGIAGNANPNLQIGDVTIPRYWAHSGLWLWQRYGDGADDWLPFESSGDFNRKIGALNISEYNVGSDNKDGKSNLLNNVWLQEEEIYPVNGIPEQRQHVFWVPVDKHYFAVSEKLQGLEGVHLLQVQCNPVDMETAAVAVICYQQRTPFIALRSLSDLAGGGSALPNEASTFSNLAAQNDVDALIKFIDQLGS
ncbi:hypothetical protein CRG98_003384 [Punica granatum]|uniref:Nucleoside phosphorylase domain-containing protein n=1 Tax=Punica granatum TaxID=22663 RepID=A0A2I0L6L7_PUNGR|nr:hypothetical protein CRG98_003384 [Punica granatum]